MFAALLLVTAGSVRADQRYAVSGEDVYRIGASQPSTDIAYSGFQRLSIQQGAKATRFVAVAKYTRSDQDGRAIVRARFVQRLLRDGTFEDVVDADPDFLTILNQPFAIELDPRTMADLHHLHANVPFEATSPLGGAHLRGYLRPMPQGKVHGIESTGVGFSAQGPMVGSLPDHPTDTLHGTIEMAGTAYYSLKGALLVALDATLTIEGKLLTDGNAGVPVKIVYHRVIRAVGARSKARTR